MTMVELAWVLVGFLLTLMIFSYIIGDNPLFKIASYVFVGAASGYLVVMIIYQVIVPRIVIPLLRGDPTERMLTLVPMILGIFLLFKIFPRLASLGNLSMGYLVGIGAAVTIGGAVTGTIITQVKASAGLFDPTTGAQLGIDPVFQLFEGAVVLLGTIAALAYFQFGVPSRRGQQPRRPKWMKFLADIGQIFIAVTLGALFAGVYSAAVTALVERLDFILKFILRLFT